jgi:hypothetical protein
VAVHESKRPLSLIGLNVVSLSNKIIITDSFFLGLLRQHSAVWSRQNGSVSFRPVAGGTG